MKKPVLGMPALKFLNLLKPALGMLAFATRTTLVKFLKLDVLFSTNYIRTKLIPFSLPSDQNNHFQSQEHPNATSSTLILIRFAIVQTMV